MHKKKSALFCNAPAHKSANEKAKDETRAHVPHALAAAIDSCARARERSANWATELSLGLQSWVKFSSIRFNSVLLEGIVSKAKVRLLCGFKSKKQRAKSKEPPNQLRADDSNRNQTKPNETKRKRLATIIANRRQMFCGPRATCAGCRLDSSSTNTTTTTTILLLAAC